MAVTDFSQYLQPQALSPQVKTPVTQFSDFLQTQGTQKVQQAPQAPSNWFGNYVQKYMNVTDVQGRPTTPELLGLTKQVPRPSMTDLMNSTTASLLPQTFVTTMKTPEQLQMESEQQRQGKTLYAANQFANMTALAPLADYAKSIFIPTEEQKQYEAFVDPAIRKGINTALSSDSNRPTPASTASVVAWNIFSRIFRPGVQQFGDDLAQIRVAQQLANQVATGQMPKEALDGLDVLHKSGLQIVGDTAQFVMTADLGGKATQLYSKAATAEAGAEAEQMFKNSLVKNLVDITKMGVKEGAWSGFEFGVAQAMSSGSTDPKELANIIFNSTLGGAVMGGGTTLAGKYLQVKKISDVVAGINEQRAALEAHFTDYAKNLGYTPQEAMQMLYQGGYIGGLPEKGVGEPTTEPAAPMPDSNTQLKTSKFISSLQKNPEVASEVVQELNGQYQVASDAAAVQRAAQLIQENPAEAQKLALGNEMTKDAVTTAMVLFKEANNRFLVSKANGQVDWGALQDAKTYGQKLINKGTTAGQTVQAFSLQSKDLSDPNNALMSAMKVLDSSNRSVMPTFDEGMGSIARAITDFNGQIADQVIASMPELQPKAEEPTGGKTEGGTGETAKPAAPKQKMEVKAPENPLPRTPLTDLMYAEALLGGDTGQFGERTPEQRLAAKVKLEDAVSKAPKPVQDMMNMLWKIAQEDLPKKGKAVPRDPIELMGQAIRDKNTYTEVFKKFQDLVRIKYQNNPEALQMFEQFFGRDLQGELPIAESQVTKSVQNEMKAQGIDLGQLVKQHYTEFNRAGQTLAESIAQKADISEADAVALADRVQQKFNELAANKKESMLRQMLKERRIPIKKTDIQRIAELTNLGAFDNQSLRNAVAEKIGLSTLSDADAKSIVERSLDIQQLPQGEERTYKTNLLRKMIADLKPTGKGRIATTIFKQSLFSAAFTKKLAGEVSMQTLESSAKVLGTALDQFIGAVFTGKRTVSTAGFAETFKAIPQALRSGVSMLHTEVGTGLMEQMREQMGKAGISDFHGGVRYTDKPLFGVNSETINMWANLPSRVLGMTTDIFQNVSLPASLAEQARVAALNEGLKGQELKARTNELYHNPTEEMVNTAIDHALYMTFQDNSAVVEAGRYIKKAIGKFAEGMTGAKGSADIASEVTLPVFKTPSNIFMRMMVDYGPLSPFKALVDQYKSIKTGGGFDQKAFVTDVSRMSTGGLLMYLGGWLASKGLMTGNYPTTKEERAAWIAEGKTQNSVLIGGKWLNLGVGLAPIGELMGLGADFNKLSQDNSGVSLLVSSGFESIKKIGDMPMMYGLSTDLAAVQNPETYSGSKFVENLVASFVPAIVRQTARSIDPVKRNPQGIWQQIEARVPGLSKNVPVARDVLGNTETYPGGVFANLDPLQASKNKPQPILDEAQRLGVSLTAPNQTIDGVKMSNDELQRYEMFRGFLYTTVFKKMMDSPTYQNLSDDDKKTVFENFKAQSNKMANEMIFPKLMIKRFGLPEGTNPMLVKQVLSYLSSKHPEFAKANDEKKAKALKILLQIK